LPAFAKGGYQQNSTKLYNISGSEPVLQTHVQKIEGFLSPLKLGSKNCFFGFNSTKLCQMPQNRTGVLTHPL